MANAFDKTVEAILNFLNQPQNAALKQELLQDQQNFDLSFLVDKLQKAMTGQVSTTGLLWHGRDFGEALYDALVEIKKSAPSVVVETQDLMDVVLEDVGNMKLSIVKMLRQLTTLDLKGAMTLVDNLPAVIMEAVPPSKATSAQKAFTENGARISLRPSQK